MENKAEFKPINKNSSSQETINIGFKGETETEQMLSNFAPTKFELDGKLYKTVESFWQSLKFDEGSEERERIAGLSGFEAKKAGKKVKGITEIEYQGQTFQAGSKEHQDLMKKALKAKFEQNPNVLDLLLATGHKKITHILKDTRTGFMIPDSQTIPGKIFCGFLMDLREEFRKKSLV